jgi:ABC-type multidrug transport system fused ATPase/permease subunit
LKRTLDDLLAIQMSYRHFLERVGSIYTYEKFNQELDLNQEKITNNDQSEFYYDKEIEFKDVSFSYKNSREILTNIDLKIKPKTTVAIVGESGSGKSTLMTLLTGALEPSSGSIVVGQKNLADINILKWRRGIGYVIQESTIFNDSIANNISLWKGGRDATKVSLAASNAHLGKLISSSSDGIQTLLGDNGIRISGGERQRINIAREIFKDVHLMMFDEATSSLDVKTEQEIKRNIDEMKGCKTVVIIAHRLSTVVDSDMIVVLDKGSIVEQGSFGELMGKKGAFHKLMKAQTDSMPTVGGPA